MFKKEVDARCDARVDASRDRRARAPAKVRAVVVLHASRSSTGILRSARASSFDVRRVVREARSRARRNPRNRTSNRSRCHRDDAGQALVSRRIKKGHVLSGPRFRFIGASSNPMLDLKNVSKKRKKCILSSIERRAAGSPNRGRDHGERRGRVDGARLRRANAGHADGLAVESRGCVDESRPPPPARGKPSRKYLRHAARRIHSLPSGRPPRSLPPSLLTRVLFSLPQAWRPRLCFSTARSSA